MVTSSIKSPQDIADATNAWRNKRQEHVLVLTLDTGHRIIRRHVVAIGSLDKALFHPRDVFYRAIKDNAKAIILVHNHPSGRVEPSELDQEITDRIGMAGGLMGIPMVDHVIITKNGWYSFRQEYRIKDYDDVLRIAELGK
jgi:DNA repair protein RadC